jgi:hypothetical protein
MALSNFIGSPLFWLIVYCVVIYYVLKIVSDQVFGQPIGAVLLNNRRVNFEDIDANAHMRRVWEESRGAMLSKNLRSRRLYIRPLNDAFYTTEWAGMKKLGRVKGVATYPSYHAVWFRRGWGIRKWLFIAPPDMLLSGANSQNLVYEGTSVRVLNQDIVYPVPSIENERWNEQAVREWALLWYKTGMKEMSDATLVDFAEYLLIKSGSDPTEARMAQQQIYDAMDRMEGGAGDDVSEVPV